MNIFKKTCSKKKHVRLTLLQKRRLMIELRDGVPRKELVKKYNVCKSTVDRFAKDI